MSKRLTPTANGTNATESNPKPGRRLLLVIDEPCTSPDLCTKLRMRAGDSPIHALVIAPTHAAAATQWYIDEDAAQADATRRLRACIGCLTRDGISADGRLGDPDPIQAIADALDDFPADEILLVTAPQRPSSWLRPNAIDRAQRSFNQPIQHLVMRRMGGPG